jgi:divalent metal cation (Fe/Co/Zn/Cd) transporter
MVVEAVVGIGVGVAAHALALQAFGVDSVIELVSGSILFWRLSVQVRGAPLTRIADAERRASGVVGWALLALGGYIVAMSVVALASHDGARPTLLGVGLAAASALIMPYLAARKQRIGAQIGSPALAADGACSLICAYMAATALIGLGLTALVGWWWLNPLSGLAVVYFVAKEGLEAVHEAHQPPFDRSDGHPLLKEAHE